MRIVKCSICGKEFETDKPNKKYCSLNCKEAGRKLKRIYWKGENPNYNAEYAKLRRSRPKEA